jgi:hypothetical protein
MLHVVGSLNVLVLYFWLTLAIPLFLLGAQYNMRATLAVSAAIWALPQIFPQPFSPFTEHVFYNPFAWQFLFAIGMSFGIKYPPGGVDQSVTRWPKWIISAAWVIVAASAAYKFSLFVSQQIGHELIWMRIPWATAKLLKSNLSALYLVHFFSVAILVANYVPRTAQFLKWTLSKIVIKTGSRPAEIYSLTVVLSLLMQKAFEISHATFVEKLLINAVGVSLVGACALLLTGSSQRVVRQPVAGS